MDDYDLLGGNPDRPDYDAELAEYIAEYGLDVGLAIYKEDNGLDLTDYDIGLLHAVATGDSADADADAGGSAPDYSASYVDNGGSLFDADADAGSSVGGYSGSDLPDDTGAYNEWSDGYPDPDDMRQWDVYERDDALDLSPGSDGFEPYEHQYTIYLNDGSVREGSVMIYHEDTDIEDVIWAANEDLDYSDGVIG